MTTPLQKLYYGLLGIGGGLLANQVTKTTAYTCDSGSVPDYVVLCNFSAAHAITLPAVSSGRVIRVKDIAGNAATYAITVTPASGNVDGQSNYIIQVNHGAVELTCDGTNWWVTNVVNYGS
jgi:hypothetical protein